MIHYFLCGAELILYLYFITGALYLLLLAIAGRLSRQMKTGMLAARKKILVLIPAYREDGVIVETALSAALHNYPPEYFKVLVVADTMDSQTIQKLTSIPVQVLEVQFVNSSKARSILAGLQYSIPGQFQFVVLLDADNIMEDGMLEHLNAFFEQEPMAVQCHRRAKNQDVSVAKLDAIGEAININLFRRGAAALGLPAMPLGSAMAFDFNLMRSMFEQPGILDNPAEDREVEIELLKRGIRLTFLDGVHVYDEKVSDSSTFQKQRTRWLEAQLNQFRRLFEPDMRKVRRTPGYWNLLFQTMILPRLLTLFVGLFVLALILIQCLTGRVLLFPTAAFWIVWMATYFLALLISIPLEFYTISSLKAMLRLPSLAVAMLKALAGIKRNRKEFLHTQKSYRAK